MNCKCGVQAFFYETIKADGIKYSVYKCGTVASESKRGKCSLNLEIFVNKIKVDETLIYAQRNKKQPEILQEENCDSKIKFIKISKIYKNLENYIYLLEISKNNYGMSKDNYISNINFLLKKLNLPLFFPNNELLTSLKSRIYDTSYKKKYKQELYPISILEIPENLRTQNRKCIRKTKLASSKNYKKFGIPRMVLNPDDILNSIKKMEIKSDSENENDSDSENDDDNSFDVDISDSEIEDNFCDDGGGLSD